VDSWLHHLNPETASEYAYLIGMIVKGADDYNSGTGRSQDVAIRAVDARTFEITMPGPAAYAIDMIAHYAFNPLPMHVFRGWGTRGQGRGTLSATGLLFCRNIFPTAVSW